MREEEEMIEDEGDTQKTEPEERGVETKGVRDGGRARREGEESKK